MPGSPTTVPLSVPPDEITWVPPSVMLPLTTTPPDDTVTVPESAMIRPLPAAPLETFTDWPPEIKAEVNVWPEVRFSWVM